MSTPTSDLEARSLSGLESAILLGLAGKAEQMFARPDHYLSYPLALWGLDPEEFHAAVNDPLSAPGVRGQADFSDLVNRIPTGVIWLPRQGTRLWDIHAAVLDADLAEVVRTPADEAAFDEAFELLKVADGELFVDSPMVVSYEQCRDAYIAAVQEFNNRAGQAELSDDPDVVEQWEIDKDSLQAAVDEANDAWETDGHRAAVERARDVMRNLGSRSPAQVWQGYRKLFDPDLEEIFFKTGPEGLRFVPTGYIPTDVAHTAWATITLTADELTRLAAGAPEELRDRLGATELGNDVVSVAVEYSMATVHRSWWTPDPYYSDAWRFHDPDRVLSDGHHPPSGDCTATVSALILVRNIRITKQQPRANEPSGRVRQPPSRRRPPRPRRRATRSPRRRGSVRDHRTSSSVFGAVRRATRQVTRRARRRRTVDHRSPPPRPTHRAGSVPSRRSERVPARPTPPPPAAAHTEQLGGDEIFVLSFECKPLPECPDPNLSLQW